MKSLALFAALGILCRLPSGCSQSDSASTNPPRTTYRVVSFVFSENGSSRKVTGAELTPAFFPAAKARPLLGRLFLPEEYKTGRHQAAVIGERFWREQLGADLHQIGAKIQLSEKTFTIVGIIASSFEVPASVDLWVSATDSAQSQEDGKR
jgi:hypothetical protein